MINKIDVGKRIGSLRKNLHYSQAEFAEKLNVSTQAVSNGKQVLRYRILMFY